MAIEQLWVMDNSDINVVGVQLGYDWNAVCNEVQREGLYGEDGDGSTSVARDDVDDFTSPMIKAIFEHIFATHPTMDEIKIVN